MTESIEQLPAEAFEEFKNLYFKKFQVKLSDKEAKVASKKFIKLISLVSEKGNNAKISS